LKKYSVADPKLHIAFEDEMKGPRLVHIADLFVPPANDTLSKAKIPMKEQALAWGKVFLRYLREILLSKSLNCFQKPTWIPGRQALGHPHP
jgi:hypothetical protein